ncbi:hypothetical protein [Peromfec virus RodF8_10]|uniref:Uncharacterized protein n=1 Tax=Peromfec virus RodF8_10 TaxID=2929357 RepID=A0A976N1X7_9VIRU|nr:hypothetical protein [Peromfec virus RodF8_10]
MKSKFISVLLKTVSYFLTALAGAFSTTLI